MIALSVELACTGELKPCFVVLGYRLVQQRALRMARVVEFGLRYGRHKYCLNAQYFAASGFACIAKEPELLVLAFKKSLFAGVLDGGEHEVFL